MLDIASTEQSEGRAYDGNAPQIFLEVSSTTGLHTFSELNAHPFMIYTVQTRTC
jgi:hypothetical protein